MAIFFDAPVDPDALTTFIREVPIPGNLALQNLFGRRELDTNKVDFAEIVRTNRTAQYRSWDGRLHVTERDTGSEKYVRLPALSDSLSVGEYERLQQEFARVGGGENQRALERAIYNDAENLTRYVLNRLELAWGDVLTDGILSINEGGLVSTADFGVPGTHKVNTADSWANVTTADVLTELIAWTDVYVATNGFKPGSILTSQRVQRLMQRNTEIINAVHGAAASRTRVTAQELNDLLDSEGIPTLRPAYDSNVDVEGSTTRIIADDKLIFLPPNVEDLGYTAYGITATALELVNSNEAELSFEEAPGIVGVVEKTGPPYRAWTFVDAAAMPILVNPRLLFIADVVA